MRAQGQVALRNALLQKAGINALSLQQLASDFNHRIEGITVGKRTDPLQEACSFLPDYTVQQELTLRELDDICRF